MKYLIYFLLIYITISKTASAQNTELINSGEVIKRGAALYDSGQYKNALIELNKVNRSDTNYVWSVYEKALNCEADSQYSQAIKYCEEGLALKEQREYEAELYNTYGNTLNDMGQPEKAIKVFDAAIARYPGYSLLYYNKGVVLLGLNKLEYAEHLFQQSLLINPYMYSAHFQLGVAALKQGKIIPSFLSLTGYLLVNPQGRFWQKSVNLLNQISKSTDEILQLKNKRTTTQSANYQEAEDILLSKIALDNAYKSITTLDDPICRQIQAMFEKLEFKDDDNDFWIQYYLPFYKKIFNEGEFEPFIYDIFSNVKLPAIEAYNKKNKKTLEAFTNDAADYFNNIRATRVLMKKDRDTLNCRYYYENGLLFGKGKLVNSGKTLNGYWEFYYPQGNIKSRGIFNANGEREGTWLIYFRSGKLKAKETSKNGKLEGLQEYYFENGNPSSTENYANGDPDGVVTTYYYAGNTRSITRYRAGKKDGEVKTFFSNGNLESLDFYVNGALNGLSKAYFKSGVLKEVEQYSNGKAEGPYKAYHENGAIATEGQNIKDNAEGEWKYYFDNGKLQEKRNYVNGLEDGLHEEYDESGQLSASYQSK
jgi:antitoxin component YwqK of YwqJK toxin-antitoxin module/Tfp pilus assembly protein PilF